MSIDFILPDIGEGIVECELVEWLVAEGDVIAEDQPVADVMLPLQEHKLKTLFYLILVKVLLNVSWLNG